MKIYILLTHTGTILSKTIKAYTNEPYTHVSIAFDIQLNEVYSFGRLRTNNPLIAGFVKEDINKGVYKKYVDTSCAVLELNITLEQYNNLRKIIIRFIRNKDKYKYNFIGLIGIAIGYTIERKNAYFCSQFVATILEQCGVKLFNKKAAFVTPCDFRTSEFMSLIYCGSLFEYKNLLNLIEVVE